MAVIGSFSVDSAKAQEVDSLKSNHIRQLEGALSIKREDAVKVVKIMEDYKVKVKEVIANSLLDEDAKRVQITALIAQKNQQLRLVLPKEKMQKIVPTSEGN